MKRTAKKTVLVIDGQGGGIGVQLVRGLSGNLPEGCELICVGTNALATSAMLKAGALRGATGENAMIYNAGRADIILGPIGTILNNGIMGEVSPAMAAAVTGSDALKLLIPSNTCGIFVAGAEDCKLDEAVRRAVARALKELSDDDTL